MKSSLEVGRVCKLNSCMVQDNDFELRYDHLKRNGQGFFPKLGLFSMFETSLVSDLGI